MKFMLATRVRIASALLLLAAGTASAASAAATSDFKIYLDLDNDQATGCALLPTLSPSFTTADQIIDITINIGATRTVAGVTRLVCNPVTHMFDPATAPTAAIGPGLGTPVGNTPSDVIETALALAGTGAGKQVRIGYTSVFNGNGATDQLLTLNGTPTGLPIVLQLIPDIPALGPWGLLALGLLLTGSAFVVIRRRGHRRAAMLLLVLALGSGLAWAAGLVVDGNPSDWTGVDAVIATDVPGDAAANADIVKAFAALQTNTLYLRLDVLFETLPTGVNDSYSTLEGTALSVPAPGVLANDTGDNLMATPQVAAATAQGGTVTLNADGSFTYTPLTGFIGVDSFTYTVTNSSGSSTATVSITVSKEAQTVSFTSTAPVGATVGGPTYTATATATSGLPVALTIDPSASAVCTISGSTVSFTGVGTCVIDADQPGNGHYSAAPQVQQSFAVGQGAQTLSFTSTAPASATVGGPTYTATATATPSGLPVALTIDPSASAVCTISGSTVSFTGVGTCVIDANQPGDANYSAAAQVQQSFAVGQGSQTITFTSTAPAAAAVGGATYTVTATASSSLPVTFTIDASASAVCTISGSTVSFIGVGTCVIDANQPGNANYTAAAQAQQSFAVGKGTQTISFTSTAPAAATVAGPTYTVTATATPSSLPVAFTIDASATSVCSISGSTVSFIGIGTCVIDANQAGNANYNAAAQVQQSFAVGKGSQTITFTSTAPAAATVGGPTYTVTATASSSLTVAFTIDPSASTVCTISGSTVSFIGVGTCVIDANQAGNANYNAAPQAQQSFLVGKGTQTLSFTSTAPAGASVGGATYTVTATATPSSLPVAFTIDASATAVCTISGSTVSFIGVGTCVIDANQAGNANYNAAAQAQQSFPVAKGTQTLSFTSTAPAGAAVAGPTYTVAATATPSGLPVTFTIDASATAVCSISGSTVSFIGAGTCVIDANQPGNANYNAAAQAQQSFPVAKGSQTLSFTSTAPAGATVAGPTYTATATATSGLPVTLTIDPSASAVCSISGSTVSFIGAGTCVIDANQPGNANYNAATQVQQSFPVVKGSQTISFTSAAPAGAAVGGPTYTVTATATSGLPVTFAIDPSASAVCTISGSTVSFIGTGTCVIDANQAGNANYNAAPQAQQSFAVAKGSQTISYTSTAPVGAAVGGPTYTVTATATSGLPVTFTIDPSASAVCTISGSTVSFIGAGTCVIDANQAGNANYNAAPQAQQSFAVGKGSQTISFTSTAPVGEVVGGPTYTVTATATSGLAVTFTIDATAASVCTISGSTVSFIGAGTCVIDANQAGNANYNAAAQAQQSFAVGKGSQTISFTSTPPASPAVGGTYAVSATATSGLSVTFTIAAASASVCSISGSMVTFIGTGTCTINANQAGNANYNAAPQVQQSFTVNQAPQITSANATSFTSTVAGSFTVTTTGFPTGASMVISESGSLPSGVTFVDNHNGTATLAGTPAAMTQGSYSIMIMANNGIAPAANQTFTLTVLNNPPQLATNPVTYTTPGNTQLQVAGATLPGVAAWTDNSGLIAKSGATDSDGPGALSVVPASGTTGNGGTYSIAADGSFTYVPAAGFTGADTFNYQVTDTQTPTTGTVNITVGQRVWYIRDIVDANNPAGGDGRSTNAFDSIAAFNAATTNAGDIIYIFQGNTATTPLSGSITLKDSQKLWGQGIALDLTGNGFGVLVTATSKAHIQSTAASTPAVSIPATAGNRNFVEVRGLDLSTTGATSNAVDVTSSGANTVSVTISDNNVSGATGKGVNLSEGGTGAFTATLNNNALAATGNAFDASTGAGAGTLTISFTNNAVVSNATGININGAAGGTTWITDFANNAVSQNNVGTGIAITSAKFDATPGGGYQTVSGGTTVVGASGNGVGASGVVLANVSGDLAFTDLDIFADAGAALRITGTGAVNTGAGTGTRVTVGAGVATFAATGGPAVDVTNTTIDLQLASLTSTNSASTGVNLDTDTGTFSAPSGSAITNATGTDFNVNAGTAAITYGGTITDTTGRLVSVTGATGGTISFAGAISDTGSGTGQGIFLNGNTGATIGFTAPLTLSTGASDAFTATGGGTVTATDTTSTVVTTTGTALNVANTTIGVAGLKFKSISAGTAASGPASGIILNNTGASGGLTVSGTGSAGSGGTIQKTTSNGIALTSVGGSASLTDMNISNTAGDGITAATVKNFSCTLCTISNPGSSANKDGLRLTELSGTASLTNVTVTGAATDGCFIQNSTATLASLTITGGSFGSTNNAFATADSGLIVIAKGTGSITAATVSGTTFASNFSTGLQSFAQDTATIGDISVSGCTFTNNGAAAADFDAGTGTPNMKFHFLNNLNITGNLGPVINVFSSATATGGLIQGRIDGNHVGTTGVLNSGSTGGPGVRVFLQGAAGNVTIVNNVIRETSCSRGIDVETLGPAPSNGATRVSDIVITGNDVDNSATSCSFPEDDIYLASDNQAGTATTLRAEVHTNKIKAAGASPANTDYPFDGNTWLYFNIATTPSTAQLVNFGGHANANAEIAATQTSGTAGALGTVALIAGPITTVP
jgi:hypothetical protein